MLYTKVYRPDDTVYACFVVNMTDKPMQNATIQLSAPGNLKVEICKLPSCHGS